MTAGAAALVAQMPSVAQAATGGAKPSLSTAYQAFGPTDIVDATCPSADVCLAIGGNMLYRSADGGANWTPSPVIGGNLGNTANTYVGPLQAISCGSPDFCVLEYAETFLDLVVESTLVSLDGGQTWQAGGGVGEYTPMTDLSCTADGACVGDVQGRLESTTDEGANWVLHPRSDDVTGVSCVSARRCFVAQSTAAANGSDLLTISSTTNRGGSLKVLLTSPGTRFSAPPVLSCASTVACTVITSAPGFRAVQLSTSNAGSTWRTLTAPQDTGRASGRAQGLQCVTPQDCTLLTTDPATPSSYDTFTTSDGGESWTTVRVGRLGSPAAPSSLSCRPVASASPSASQCVAALSTRSVFAAEDLEDGTATWSATPVGAGTPTLSAVACQQDGRCIALGTGIRGTSSDDGTTWTVTTDGALRGDVISSVSCPLVATCFAAGRSGTPEVPVGLVLVTTDLGATWTTASVPWEVGAVSDVQCASASTCLALPGFSSALSDVPTFVLRSTDGGATWTLVELAPASAGLQVTALSCPTATHCLAVGAGNGQPLVEVSDDAGATWTAVAANELGGAGDTTFDGIACTTSTECETAVVTQASDYADVYAYATTDGGTTWSQVGLMDAVEQAGYWGADPELASCAAGVCAGFSVNVVGPERPSYYDDLLVSIDGGSDWTVDAAPFQTTGLAVTVAPNGNVIAVGTNGEDGPLIQDGS